MVSISVCMIVKDEEAVLDRCLRCVSRFADELIIVDTGSCDDTKAIALRYSEQVYDFTWTDDFSAARNYSFSKAHKDYCMWIDADDMLAEADISAIQQLKQTLSPDVSVVMMRYATAFDEEGKPTFCYYRERMVRRSDQLRWEGMLHETLPLVGKLLYTDITIRHKKVKPRDEKRNLRIFEKMKAMQRRFTDRDTYYYGRELYEQAEYERAAIELQKVILSQTAWKEYKIGACERLGYIRLWHGDQQAALRVFMESFLYDEPRAELCCAIGSCFFQRKAYAMARYWYEQASRCTLKEKSGAFIRKECYDFIPALQLCLCYWYMGDRSQARHYHEAAKKLRPSDARILYNERFFQDEA